MDRPGLVTGAGWTRNLIEAGRLEGSEIFVAPHRDGADGVLGADLTVPSTVEGLVDEPVRLQFAGGRVTPVAGGRAAALLRELVGRDTGAYGGDNEASIHVDLILSAPEVEADGRRIELR